MPRTLTAIILISLLLFVCQASAQAKDLDPGLPIGENRLFTDNEETDITGYGDIPFGSIIQNLDVTVTRIESLPGALTKSWIVRDKSYQTFTIADKTFDALTAIGSLDGSTVATVVIILHFPLSMDLDKISLYVRAVRSMYMGKYPQLPVDDTWVWDYDNYHTDWWVGDLEIKDQDDDDLWVEWDGYSLTIRYRTAKYQQAILDNAVERITDQLDKI